MLKSMTAFARVATPATKTGGWIIEIRSINHRFFDFSLKLPPDYYALEGKIRELIHSKISRGKVTVSITQGAGEDSETDHLTLDLAVAKRYQQAAERIKRQLRIRDDIDLGDFLRLPQILTVKKEKKSPQKVWPALQRALHIALSHTLKAKTVEGKKIEKDILNRLAKIQAGLGKIEADAKGRSEEYFKRIQTRLESLIAEGSRDDDRLWREAAILAEKSDITEEIVRLKSHLSLFEERVRSRKIQQEVGRELDFICQEMHREINTIGNKAQLFDISREVVFIKGEIEKIREQIQNVE